MCGPECRIGDGNCFCACCVYLSLVMVPCGCFAVAKINAVKRARIRQQFSIQERSLNTSHLSDLEGNACAALRMRKYMNTRSRHSHASANTQTAQICWVTTSVMRVRPCACVNTWTHAPDTYTHTHTEGEGGCVTRWEFTWFAQRSA